MNLRLKRFLSILLAAVLVLTMLPVSAFAEATYPVTGSCGESLAWSLDENGTLTISGTGEMADYTADGGQPWAGYSAQISSLIIENGVTKLGAFAFDGLSALATVVFKGSAPQIGQYCFFGTTVTAAYTCDATWTSDVLKNYGGTITWSATHTGDEITDPAVEPTCTKTGLTEGRHCSACGIILKAQTTVPATGHNYGEWIVTKEATCTTDGEENRTCATCGEVETHIIAAAHSWDDGVITTQPTNTSTGVKLYTCTVCSETKEEILPATSLSYGSCGTNLTYVLETNGTLTISGNGYMENYRYSERAEWYYNYSYKIKTVVIEDGVTSIGSYAFYDCTNIAKVYIPDSVTSIGGYAFRDCSSLTSITIPDGVTNIGSYAFDNCKNLTSITIGNGVTSIGDSAFIGCFSLTSIIIPDGVMSIGNRAFYSCSKLANVYYSGDSESWNKINISSDNENLTKASIHYNSTGTKIVWTYEDGVLTIGGSGEMDSYYANGNYLNRPWQAYLSEITTVVIEDGVTSIGSSAFRGCTSLTSITIPDSVTSIGRYAFRDCSSLTSIIIPDSVTSIGYSAFYNCYRLTSISIPDAVTSIGIYAFYGCSSLTSVTIGNGVTSIGNNAFSRCSSLANVTIGNGVTSIGSYAFYDCSSLMSINIPNSVTSIDDSAFSGCSKLANVHYSGDSESWGNISIASGNTRLTNAFIHYNSTGTKIVWTYADGVLTIGGSGEMDSYYANGYYLNRPWQAYLSEITTVVIEDGVTSIGEDAFFGCFKLVNVHYSGDSESWGNISIASGNTCLTNAFIHYNSTGTKIVWTYKDGVLTIGGSGEMDSYYANGNYLNRPWQAYLSEITTVVVEDGVTSIGNYAFRGCSSLTSATIGNSVTSIGDSAFEWRSALTSINIPDSVTSIGNSAFYGCSSLTSITIPNGVTSIGGGAFSGCSSLVSITIPDGVTSIGSSSFYGCSSLTSINIPDGVTSIGDSAFDGCSSLTSINIPDSVTSIGEDAFYNCSKLANVHYSGDSESWKKITISSGNTCLTNAFIHYNSTGTKIVWTYKDGVLTIGGSGEMDEYKGFLSSRPWQTYLSEIKTVVIEDGVTSIGGNAFDKCTSLRNVTIGNSVTSIGNNAFSRCSSLTSINIPDGVASIGDIAFYDCSSLTNITIPDSVTSIGECAFDDCSKLANVHYSGDSESWKKIKISNYNHALTNAFIHYNSTGTKIVWTMVWTTEGGVLTISGSGEMDEYKGFLNSRPWLAYLKNIKYVVIEGGVTTIGSSAFEGMSALTEVTFKGSAPKFGENCFKGTAAVAKYTCDETWTSDVLQNYGGTIIWNATHTGEELVDKEAVAPTCTKSGLTESKKCSVCGVTILEQKVVDALGHTEVIDAAVAPTCTKTGLTEGKHCLVCNAALVEQKVVDALGHTEVIDKAVAPTCTQTGLTEGKHCSVCNAVLVEQKVVDALGHTEVIDKAVAPTCTKTGLTEGKHCSVCNAVLVEQKVVGALGHTIVIDKAVNPTYNKTGLTAGSHCSVCNEVITKQKVVPMKLVAAPKKVKAQSAGYARVRISWGKVSYATGYAVYRATSKKGTYKYIGKTSKNYYTDAKRTTGTTYYYKVRAYRTVNKANKYGAYSAIVYAKALPATPVLTAKNAGTRKIKLSWKKISGAHGYEIYRATSKNGKYALAKRVTSGSTLSFTNTRLTRGKTYYYKIRAYRTVKRSRKYGAFSTVKYAKG